MVTCDCTTDPETGFEYPGPICRAAEMKEWMDSMDRWREVKDEFITKWLKQ